MHHACLVKSPFQHVFAMTKIGSTLHTPKGVPQVGQRGAAAPPPLVDTFFQKNIIF